MLEEFAKRKHPDLLESLNTSFEERSSESHSKECAILNYEQLCALRGWKMKSPDTAAEIQERIELGFLVKASKVPSSEQKMLTSKEFPECSFYRYKIVSEKSISSKETARA
jgi:hypothetical protein